MPQLRSRRHAPPPLHPGTEPAGYFSSYLPEGAKAKLDAYVYHGQDKSLIYKYFWRPLCAKIVRKLPVWLAPNVITVAALVFVCITHALLQAYMPKLTVKRTDEVEAFHRAAGMAMAASHGGNGGGAPATAALASMRSPPIKTYAKEYIPLPPRSIFFLAAFALFTYQLLDNLDGHQARRTRMSSPLGLLMDHGCDAFNCIIGSLSVASTLSLGPTWKTWVFVLLTVIVFFLNTWEEYYRGELILPIVNGPNEGLLIAICFYLITGVVDGGPQWWYENRVRVPRSWLPRLISQPDRWATWTPASTRIDGQSPPWRFDLASPQQAAALAVEDAVLQFVCPRITYATSAAPRHTAADSAAWSASPDFVSPTLMLPTSFGYFFSTMIGIDCSPAWNGTAFSSERGLLQSLLKDSESAYRNPEIAPTAALLLLNRTIPAEQTPIQRSVLRMFNKASGEVEIRYNTIAVMVTLLGALVTCVGNVYHVYASTRREQAPQDVEAGGQGEGPRSLSPHSPHAGTFSARFKWHFPFLHALTRLFPLVALTFLAHLWFMTSPDNIFRDHPRIFCWTVGLLYTKLAIHLMIAHLCADEFRPFRRTFFPFVMFAIHFALSLLHHLHRQKQLYLSDLLFGPSEARESSSSGSSTYGMDAAARAAALAAYRWDEEIVLFEFFVLSAISFGHLVISVTSEVSNILQVPLFTVPLAKQQALLRDMEAEKQRVNSTAVTHPAGGRRAKRS